MGIQERFSLHCDWCGVEPEPGQTFDNYQEAYEELTRVGQREGWLVKYSGSAVSRVMFFCPECVAEGRARG